jgi:methionyl-tRNA formyltransferase
MRIIFLGSGAFGIPTLERIANDHAVVCVVTQPDRPAGRKRVPTATDAGQWAAEHNVDLIKTDNVNTPDLVTRFEQASADAAVAIAFGQKIADPTIDALGGLVVNLHGSLLPRYRGAAPINWAMIRGERETGNTVIALAQKMDAGVMYDQQKTSIDPNETAGELHDRLARLGPGQIERVLRAFAGGSLQGVEQDESLATRAPKLSKADGVVEFGGTPDAVRSRIHGLTPWPGVCVSSVSTGRELLLRRVCSVPDMPHGCEPGTVIDGRHVAVCGGAIELLQVQPPGKRVMSIDDYNRGHALPVGDVLHSG